MLFHCNCISELLTSHDNSISLRGKLLGPFGTFVQKVNTRDRAWLTCRGIYVCLKVTYSFACFTVAWNFRVIKTKGWKCIFNVCTGGINHKCNYDDSFLFIFFFFFKKNLRRCGRSLQNNIREVFSNFLLNYIPM